MKRIPLSVNNFEWIRWEKGFKNQRHWIRVVHTKKIGFIHEAIFHVGLNDQTSVLLLSDDTCFKAAAAAVVGLFDSWLWPKCSRGVFLWILFTIAIFSATRKKGIALGRMLFSWFSSKVWGHSSRQTEPPFEALKSMIFFGKWLWTTISQPP